MKMNTFPRGSAIAVLRDSINAILDKDCRIALIASKLPVAFEGVGVDVDKLANEFGVTPKQLMRALAVHLADSSIIAVTPESIVVEVRLLAACFREAGAEVFKYQDVIAYPSE